MGKPSKASAERIADVAELPADPPIYVSRADAAHIIPYNDEPGAEPWAAPTERHRVHPGINVRIAPDVWERIRANRGLIGWHGKLFRPIEHPSELDVDAIPPILKRSSSRAAIEWWLEVEERHDVRKLLTAKLDEMRRLKHSGDGQDLD